MAKKEKTLDELLEEMRADTAEYVNQFDKKQEENERQGKKVHTLNQRELYKEILAKKENKYPHLIPAARAFLEYCEYPTDLIYLAIPYMYCAVSGKKENSVQAKALGEIFGHMKEHSGRKQANRDRAARRRFELSSKRAEEIRRRSADEKYNIFLEKAKENQRGHEVQKVQKDKED